MMTIEAPRSRARQRKGSRALDKMSLPRDVGRGSPRQIFRRSASCCTLVAALCVAGCMVGPNYRKPVVQTPTDFKEAVDWRRARPDPQAALSSTWWLAYHDDTLSHLVDQSLKANQSIIAAEAASRLAKATVAANTAQLYPTVTAGLSLTRAGGGGGVSHTGAPGGGINPGGTGG